MMHLFLLPLYQVEIVNFKVDQEGNLHLVKKKKRKRKERQKFFHTFILVCQIGTISFIIGLIYILTIYAHIGTQKVR